MSRNMKPPGYLAPHLRGNPLYDPAARFSNLSLYVSGYCHGDAANTDLVEHLEKGNLHLGFWTYQERSEMRYTDTSY